MEEQIIEIEPLEGSARPSRPSFSQVKALVEFIQKHPDLAHRKLRNGVARPKIKKLWVHFSNIANSLEGTIKSTRGWIKFWSDKRRSIVMKQKQIEEGKLEEPLAPIEQKIYDLVQSVPQTTRAQTAKRKKNVKVEPYNGDDDDDSMADLFPETEELEISHTDNNRLIPTESDERQLNMMEKLIEVMDQQAQAMTQMAQSTHSNSKALERLAEASHMQALAIDRLAGTFENISSSVHDVRNAMMSIDYTMKRCYSTTTTQQRQNSNLFG